MNLCQLSWTVDSQSSLLGVRREYAWENDIVIYFTESFKALQSVVTQMEKIRVVRNGNQTFRVNKS